MSRLERPGKDAAHPAGNDLRHTKATLLLKAGVDMHRVQRILGHTDGKVTVGTYAHLQVKDLRAAVNALPVARVIPEAAVAATSVAVGPVVTGPASSPDAQHTSTRADRQPAGLISGSTGE